MILYLDSSALVKRYVVEPGADQVRQAVAQAQVSGAVIIAYAEVAAALAKAVRMGVLVEDEARDCVRQLMRDWVHLARLRVTEATVARAGHLVWDHPLRGYDAVHLAAALLWQEALGEAVTMCTFDLKLAQAAAQAGLRVIG